MNRLLPTIALVIAVGAMAIAFAGKRSNQSVSAPTKTDPAQEQKYTIGKLGEYCDMCIPGYSGYIFQKQKILN